MDASVARTTDAPQETAKVAFEQLPDVLIQDPANACAYLISADDLEAYKATPETWDHMGPDTVTFVIPDSDFVEELPPFVQTSDANPAVLIQYPRGNRAYLLTFDQLQAYRIPQPKTHDDAKYGISFIIPRGTELIEELPPLRRSLLQNQENS